MPRGGETSDRHDSIDQCLQQLSLGAGKEAPLMRIEGLGVLLTFECNAECDHCYYHSAPRSKVGPSVIEVEEFAGYMDSVARTLGYLPGVAFLGGEPFLYYKHLLQMI